VALEMNLAETAFLYRLPTTGADGLDFSLRWFTPAVEVPLCGHATLASAHILYSAGYLAPTEIVRFHTKSGILTARRHADGWLELDFPARPVQPVEAPPALLEMVGVTPKFVGVSDRLFMVEVEGEQAVRDFVPNIGLLKTIPPGELILTARADSGKPYDFVSRFFAPAVGIDEDPVTGSAHCVLTPYWSAKLDKTTFEARQVSARGGVLRLALVENGTRVLLRGQAVTTLKGELYV
jgi:PhzF family phenazine biosynthesis protein